MDWTGYPMNYLLCYRYAAWTEDSDVDSVWEFVERHGGHIEQLQATVDFYIPDQYQSFLLMRFPGLRAIPALDYVI
jgi:hypothetical protein